MSNVRPKAVLFDVDGVLVKPPRMFAEIYCQKYHKDIDKLLPFYKTDDFHDAMRGEVDLVDAMMVHRDMWQLDREPAEIIEEWLDAENYIDIDLITLIDRLRQDGVRVYLATNQEANRADYIRDEMFGDSVDGMFVSNDIGVLKEEPQFFEEVLKQLAFDVPGITPHQILLIDDGQKHLDSAKSLGIRTLLYRSPGQVEALLGVK